MEGWREEGQQYLAKGYGHHDTAMAETNMSTFFSLPPSLPSPQARPGLPTSRLRASSCVYSNR